MYNVDSGNPGAKTGFIYARLRVIVPATSLFIIPERAGLSVEDIDNAYENNTSPQDFANLRVA
jgi:SP family general alpha glucoside:H+ symporter-like MFS transporter